MANVAQLKEKARSLELREQWKAALEVYERIVEESDGEDSGLWNRLGDVRARLGQTDAAVEAYERAVELYVEAGLHNNAIALCNKILRVAPNRAATYRRLGQISAAQGFLADARHSFLEYAERMQRGGRLDESFAALGEFAALSPGDVEVRRLLADQLRAHGRTDEALEHLRALHALLVAEGDAAAAAAVHEEMRAIDPDVALDAPPSASDRARGAGIDEADAGLLPTFEISAAPRPVATPAPESEPAVEPLGEIDFHIDTALPGEAPPEAAPAATPEGLEPTRLDDPVAATDVDGLHLDPGADAAGPADDLGLLAGFEHPSADDDAPDDADGALPLLDAFEPGAALPDADAEHGGVAPLEGFEATLLEPLETPETPETAPAEPEPLPVLEPAGADALDETAPPPSAWLDAGVDEFAVEPADEDADPADEAEPELAGADEPLPLLADFGDDDSDDAAAPPPDEEPLLAELDSAMAGAGGNALDELRGALERAPQDAQARGALIEVLYERGRGAEVEVLLEETHRALAADDRFADALGVLRSLLALRGDDLALHQKQVEYAFRAGDRALLVEAYLGLAARMHADGNGEKARAVYERVLELDAENETARAALAPRPGGARARGAAPESEYVDLAALIFDEEDEDGGEPSTRFIVPEEEPTGDEARDFADMLAVFKQKVAANIDVSDSTSHYDLGLAFKDMGLLDEAIAQFQVALRGGANPLATLEVLGECFVEKGQPTLGTRVLERALRLPGASDASLIGVHYWLGRCAEARADHADAADHFERVVALDIRFRDAAVRLAALRQAPAPSAFDKGQHAG